MNNSRPTLTDKLLWEDLPIWDLVPVFSISTCKYLEVPLKPSPFQAEQDQVPCMAQQEDKKQHIQVKSRVSYWIEVKTFSPWGQSATGTGCPETVCSLHLGRILRHSCITCWETQSDFTADPALSRRLDWRSRDLQTSAITWSFYTTNSRSNTLWKWEVTRESHQIMGGWNWNIRVWNKHILLPGAA